MPAAWVGDMLKLYSLLGLKGASTKYPSPSHLVKKIQLGAAGEVFPERNHVDTNKVRIMCLLTPSSCICLCPSACQCLHADVGGIGLFNHAALGDSQAFYS